MLWILLRLPYHLLLTSNELSHLFFDFFSFLFCLLLRYSIPSDLNKSIVLFSSSNNFFFFFKTVIFFYVVLFSCVVTILFSLQKTAIVSCGFISHFVQQCLLLSSKHSWCLVLFCAEVKKVPRRPWRRRNRKTKKERERRAGITITYHCTNPHRCYPELLLSSHK